MFAKCWLRIQVSTDVSWLVFIDTAADIDHVFSDFDIPYGCEFLVAQQEGQVSLTEVYRLDQEQPLQKYRLGSWSSAGGFVWTTTSFTTRRGDLQGFPITGAAYGQVSWYRWKISQDACMSVCWTDSEMINIDVLCTQGPYIYCRYNCAEERSGFVMELWEHFERAMNFT